MAEDRDAWDELLSAGFLHAVREAHTEATLAVFGALSRTAGFTERSFGVGAFDVLESQLDRVFRLGEAAPSRGAGPVTEDPLAQVVRADLNGSPGWRYGAYRILLKRHPFGAVREIRWDRDSPTKQGVARQDYADDAQLAFDFDLPRRASGVVTLVVAHSASEEPLEMELFLGRPRMNADGGPAWHWLRPLTDDTLGADPRRRLVQATLPLWTDDEADVPMRLHGRRASAGGAGLETGIETAS